MSNITEAQHQSFRKQEHLIVAVELPRVDLNNIKASFEYGALIVRGEKKIEQDIKNHNWYLMECQIAAFDRWVTLHFMPSTNDVDDHFENVILSVRMKKTSYLNKEKQAIPIR